MPISSYPRRGHPIAPQTLRAFLDAPIPSDARPAKLRKNSKLCDLDASVWKSIEDYEASLLGDSVVASIRDVLRNLLEISSNNWLPMPPIGSMLEDLELEVRTYNCLKNHWSECERDLQRLGYKTIGDVMKLPGFGMKSLVDLLSSLEALQDTETGISSPTLALCDVRHSAEQYVNELCTRYPTLTRRLQNSLQDQLSQFDLVSDKSIWAKNARKAFDAKVVAFPGSDGYTDLPLWALSGADLQLPLQLESVGDAVEISRSKTGETQVFCHDNRLGALLSNLDEATDNLREQMHRIAWLLHSCYDKEAGAEDIARVWETLDGLMQSASHLESLVAQVEPDKSLMPQLDQRLSQLAQEIAAFPNLSDIRYDDVRLSPLLKELLTDDEILQEAIEDLLERPRDPFDCEAIKRQLGKLRDQLAALSKLAVEDELQSIFRACSHLWHDPQRKIEVLGWRYGFDGNGGHTLEECGAHFKVSRERIRQLCKPGEDDLKDRLVWMPTLDRALQWLEEQTPLPLDEVGPKLKAEGLARSELSLRTLLRIASLLQREVPLEIDVVGETSFVQSIYSQEGNDLAAQILSQARRQISRWGVATLEDIAAHVEEKRAETAKLDLEISDEAALDIRDQPVPDAVIDTALVERVLSVQSDFVLLDDAGWFWLSSVTRNGLVSQIKKVLAVAPRVRVSDLRAGVSRHHQRRGFAPPQRVLLELCRRLPGISVEGDEVLVRNTRKLYKVLSPTEQIMADLLHEHGPVMTRAELERHCSVAGIPRGTFYTYLKHSPIMEKYARSVYGLRGAQVEPGFIESLEPEWIKRRTRVLKDYGWATDGRAWFTYILSKGMLGNGVYSVPGAMRRFVQGEYSLWTNDGSYVGKWTCGDSQAWGIGPFLRRRGGEPGDILLLIIDVTARKVVAELGDETLLEEHEGIDAI